MNTTSWNVKLLELHEIDDFYPIFEKSLLNQFTEYSSNTRMFFTKQDYPKSKVLSLLKKGDRQILIALSNTRIIGYLLADKIYGGVAFCEWLGVEEGYQNKGVGTALLQEFEKLSSQNGAHKINLWTAEKNIEFYEKKGYTATTIIPSNYFGVNECLMYKTLQDAKQENYLR